MASFKSQKLAVVVKRKYQFAMWCQEDRKKMSLSEGNCLKSSEPTHDFEVTQGRKNPLWMGMSSRLVGLRKSSGTTQLALSRWAGVGSPLISSVEAQTQRPKIDTVEKIAVGMGVSPVYLAFGTEGDRPFRAKTPSYLKSDETPKPQPGTGVFRERYKGAAERLRTSRERLGLSLRDLAAAAQVSYQAVLYTETGKTVPRLDTVEAIAVALDVAPGWLAYGDDE